MLLYLQQNVLTVQCRNLCSKTHGLSPENPAKVSTPNTTSTMFPAASQVIHSWTSAPTATSCHVGASRSNTRFWGMEFLFVWVIIANLILNINECVSARMTFSNPSLVDFRVTRVHCSIISNIGPCWCISRLVVLHKLPPTTPLPTLSSPRLQIWEGSLWLQFWWIYYGKSFCIKFYTSWYARTNILPFRVNRSMHICCSKLSML